MHVERGLRYFSAEFTRLGRRGDEFLLSLLEESSRAAKVGQGSVTQDTVQTGVDYAVRVVVGNDVHSPGRLLRPLPSMARDMRPILRLWGKPVPVNLEQD